MSDYVMDNLVEAISEAIADLAHRFYLDDPEVGLEDIARAALAAIAAHTRYELVELPEPVHEPTLGLTWPVVQHWGGQRIRDGEVWIRASDGKIAATSTQNPHACLEDARSYAAALLAAAKAAEGRKGGSDE